EPTAAATLLCTARATPKASGALNSPTSPTTRGAAREAATPQASAAHTIHDQLSFCTVSAKIAAPPGTVLPAPRSTASCRPSRNRPIAIAPPDERGSVRGRSPFRAASMPERRARRRPGRRYSGRVSDRAADYDYEVPPGAVAQEPAARRADARLLLVP